MQPRIYAWAHWVFAVGGKFPRISCVEKIILKTTDLNLMK